MASPKIRLATASPATQATTRDTLAQLEQIASRAAANQADILLLPEAYLGGYPRGSNFGCAIGERTVDGREEFLQYFKGAIDLGDTVGNGAGAGEAWIRKELGGGKATDGSASQINGSNGTEATSLRGDGTREELERIAGKSGVFIVVGLVERVGGSLYCSVVYVCPQKGIIGKRRKVQPTGTERLIWAQGSPATLKAVSTTIRGVRINMAAAICWENYMPLLRQALYAQNVNLYLAPTADGRDTWLSLMRTIALEGRCFVASSNMCVRSDTGNEAANNGATSNNIDTTEAGNIRPGRRNSCFTHEGFEIALPTSPTSAKPTSRRKSIFDEHGNEIVLRSESVAVIDEDADEHTSAIANRTNGTNGAAKDSSKNTAGRFLTRGGSSITSPSGDVLAGPQWEDDQGIIYADVDFEDCMRGRLDLDAAGSYSRNDSFKFSVEGLDLDPLPY